jgi:predicted transposase YdaD
MNAAEQLRAEGRVEGRAEGRVEGRAEGRVEGRAEGLRTGISAALSGRGVSLSEMGRARLASCADVEVLTSWLTRAVTAGSEGEVFGRSDAP